MKNTKTPFFSFVIANYNNGNTIGDAIQSILNQDEDDYEIIVIDGQSSDDSVNIIKSYKNNLAYWVSEKDTGQSNAFNKGFNKAKGEFITWLNADDILLPGTVKAVKHKLISTPNADWATGNFLRFDGNTKLITQIPWGPHFLPGFLQGKGRVNPIFGPTVFWRKSVYDIIGPIDESLHFAMDVEYWSRLVKYNYKQVRVNHYCWAFRMHNQSKTAEFDGHKLNNKIKAKIKKENDYIKRKNEYNPIIFWKLMAYFFRILDGSFVKGFIHKRKYLNKNIGVWLS